MSIKPEGSGKSKTVKAKTSGGRKLKQQISVTIDGVPVILRAAKGKPSFTASQLKAAVIAAKTGKSSRK